MGSVFYFSLNFGDDDNHQTNFCDDSNCQILFFLQISSNLAWDLDPILDWTHRESQFPHQPSFRLGYLQWKSK